MSDAWIVPGWPAPANLESPVHHPRRRVGIAPFDSLNLGTTWATTRRWPPTRHKSARLLPAEPCWLNQVHGTVVVDLAAVAACRRRRGGVLPGAVCVVMTADCLPVLLCDHYRHRRRRRHRRLARAAGRGDRGYRPRDGCARRELMAWLGPPSARQPSRSATR